MKSVKINNIKLENIGPFFELQVAFPETSGINLICGDNGIGKTTLLESIVSVFSSGQITRIKKREGTDVGNIDLEYIEDEKIKTSRSQISAFTPDEKTNSSSQLVVISKNIIYVKATRDFNYVKQETISRDPSKTDFQHSHDLILGIRTDEIKTWFTNRFLLRPHADSSSWTKQMLQNFTDAKTYFSLLDENVALDRVDVRTFDIIVSTPSGKVPFEYLSSGFRSAFVLLLGILKEIEFRALDVSGKDFSGVIIIDELDLHLHPTWQTQIAGALKSAFPKAQIIASTHSPHIIQAAQASEVVALVRDETKRVVQRTPPSSQYGYSGWTLEEVLEDIMGVSDTKTPVFRQAMKKFDEALDKENPRMIKRARLVLEEMLHPNSPLRKLIAIQSAPYSTDTGRKNDSIN